MESESQNTLSTKKSPPHPRHEAIDLLRGLAMIVMALDHVRIFFSHDVVLASLNGNYETTPILFFTRWITHFCAPIFFFLAGTGAYLSMIRGKTKSELSLFLLTRGLWLVFLELTIVLCLGWRFNFDYEYLFSSVIWALGWSMVAMSAIVYLPIWAITAIGIVMIAGHNTLDAIDPNNLGAFSKLWLILHHPGTFQLTPHIKIVVSYPLIPWIGVMAVGYGFGSLLQDDRKIRQKRLLILGTGLTMAFFILRAINIYGNPHLWSIQKNILETVGSFINCEKYPPSLLFLLMTLGPSIVALAFFDRDLGKWTQPIIIFGRVPLFFYLLHLPLIHAGAVILAYIKYGRADWLFTGPPQWAMSSPSPQDYGFSLLVVYLIWVVTILIVYPVCRWFAQYKQKHKYPWLSYL